MSVPRAHNSSASTGRYPSLQGFDITVALTVFNFPNPSDYPDFDFLKMSDGLCEQNASSYNFIDAISGFNATAMPHCRSHWLGFRRVG